MSKKNDLFNNPMVESALKALTPEQLEEYERIGKYMFQTDFTATQGPDPEKEMKEAIFYIREGLKSGLHPEDLSPKELEIMYDVYGDDWGAEYGYERREMPPRPTLASGLGNPANPLPSDNLTPSEIKELQERGAEATPQGSTTPPEDQTLPRADRPRSRPQRGPGGREAQLIERMARIRARGQK